MKIKRFKKGQQRQYLHVADLCSPKTLQLYEKIASKIRVDVVYTDPPWDPQKEAFFCNIAGKPPAGFSKFMSAFCSCIAMLEPKHVFIEQSAQPKHQQVLFDAIRGCSNWNLVCAKPIPIYCGSKKKPIENALFHFGPPITLGHVSRLAGDTIVESVLNSLKLAPSSFVADPCIGFGTTSRAAHRIGINCFGTELCQSRLDRTVAWIVNKGYGQF